MDLHTVTAMVDARTHPDWQQGDAWLAGGTYLFSEPQLHVRRLIDLSRMGWEPLVQHPDGALEIAATCTVARLSQLPAELVGQCCRAFLASFKIWNLATVGGNLCNGLPAGPMISLTAALDGRCRLQARDGTERTLPVTGFVVGAGRTALAAGELLRSITLPGAALARRTAFRQASLSALGRSAVLVIGTAGPGDLQLTVTASTVRPFRVGVPIGASTGEVRDAVAEAVGDGWFADVHGDPGWRRHLTYRFAEEVRRELAP
jgi:CO/xanthine dehydrogenase FAD-binding subunit